MSPPQLLIGGVAIATMIGFLGGWTVRDWKADSAALAAAQALMHAKDEGQEKIDAKAEEFETFRQSLEPARNETRSTIERIYKDVPLPVDCALRADALGVLENARQRANAATTGEPVEPVPIGLANPAYRP